MRTEYILIGAIIALVILTLPYWFVVIVRLYRGLASEYREAWAVLRGKS